jgi:hypothetical protein
MSLTKRMPALPGWAKNWPGAVAAAVVAAEAAEAVGAAEAAAVAVVAVVAVAVAAAAVCLGEFAVSAKFAFRGSV